MQEYYKFEANLSQIARLGLGVGEGTIFSLFFYFYSHMLHSNCNFPSLPSPKPLPYNTPFFASPQKRTGTQGHQSNVSNQVTRPDINHHTRAERGNSGGEERTHKQAKESETTPAPTKTPNFSTITYMQRT